MKAIVQSEYGSPAVLRVEEVDPPRLTNDGVLVRVQATSVHAGDWHLMRGDPWLVRLIYGGIRQPKFKTLGCDMAGIVEAVGSQVTQFKVGDPVFGDLSECGFGAWAEQVCVPEQALVLKPTNLTFAEAATVPVSGIPALQGLRDVGQIQPGQRVLIHGAAGGVGSFAVQMAKGWGAEVTGICSAHKMEMVQKLGADLVSSYDQLGCDKSPLARTLAGGYDLILDAAAYRSVFDYFPLLKRGGTYVLVGGSMPRLFLVLLLGSLISVMSGRRVKSLVSRPNQLDLSVLKEWIEAGKIHPYVDRTYELSQLPDAIDALERRQVRGKVAIRVGSEGVTVRG
ncbi:MAG: NAD(P)-dependent alcohol dehydrogenase [Cyanophyceae cyanobacterium]